jgi:hypothetical protein
MASSNGIFGSVSGVKPFIKFISAFPSGWGGAIKYGFYRKKLFRQFQNSVYFIKKAASPLSCFMNRFRRS